MDVLKKIWKDPVWSKIIATGLIAISLFISNKITVINVAYVMLIDFLVEFQLIPIWLLGLLVILSSSFLIVMFLRFKKKKTFTSYTSDNFEGLEWDWMYCGSKINNLKPLCPHCKHEVLSREIGNFSSTKEEFYCEGCGFSLTINDRPIYEFYLRINRHIERKIRTGEWAKK